MRICVCVCVCVCVCGVGGRGGGLDRVIAAPWYQYFSYIQSDTFHLMKQGYFVSILL